MSSELRASPADAFACSVVGLSATHPDGRTATLDKCLWAEIAPCGCVSGMTTAVRIDVVIHTPEQALREMCESAAEYRESVQQGSRMICVLDEDFRGPFGELFRGKCPHTPVWGIQRQTREIAGIHWTRITPNHWTTRHIEKGWSIEKWSARWHLVGPHQGSGRFVAPWLGRGTLNEALSLASEYILAHPEGLERAS